MTDYKLVPIGPTPEMVSAAEDAYMPFGDMEMALRMALLAAPAVQGEPVGFCEDTALSLAERTFSSEVDEQLAEDVIQYARRLHTLYTAPQPAEQQPDVALLVEALEEIAHPVRFMQERLEEGERLNGMAAVQLAEDASYLRGIAIAALAAHRKQEGSRDQ